MQQILETHSMFRVLDVFFQDPHKNYQLREISRIIKLDHKSVLIHLKRLIKQGFIKENTKTLYKSYVADVNDHFIRFKRGINLINIYESGLVDHLIENTSPKFIVLYGSYSHGTDNAESDIDLYVESAEKKLDLAAFEKKLNRKIHILFEGNMSPELKNNLVNGIVLSGNMRLN